MRSLLCSFYYSCFCSHVFLASKYDSLKYHGFVYTGFVDSVWYKLTEILNLSHLIRFLCTYQRINGCYITICNEDTNMYQWTLKMKNIKKRLLLHSTGELYYMWN